MSTNLERWLPWVARVAWAATGVFAWSAIDAIDGDTTMRWVAYVGGGAIWIGGLIGLALSSVTTLTIARVSVPLAVPAAGLLLLSPADRSDAVVTIAAAAVTTIIVMSADVARAFVQASAYGAEQRFPLRPPLAYEIAAVIAWAIVAALLLVGMVVAANHRLLIGGIIVAIAVAGFVWAWPRWHRLARRWLVIVPAGLVVHDPLVLAETLMLRRHDIGDVSLAPADTDAADLTGPATGHALEINTATSVTALLTGTPAEPRGTAIHLTALLVSPSRPGVALAALVNR